MIDHANRAKEQVRVLQECIDVINTLDGIENRAEIAEWLAGIYRSNADGAAHRETSLASIEGGSGPSPERDDG